MVAESFFPGGYRVTVAENQQYTPVRILRKCLPPPQNPFCTSTYKLMGFYLCEFFRDPMVHLGTATRVCFVKFKDPSSVHVAQHLTNTVFIDRALIVVPVQDGEFIEREYQNIVFEMLTLPPHPHLY